MEYQLLFLLRRGYIVHVTAAERKLEDDVLGLGLVFGDEARPHHAHQLLEVVWPHSDTV